MRLKKILVLCVFTVSSSALSLAQAPKAPPAGAVATPGTKAAPGGKTAPRTIEIMGTDEMKYSLTTITARPGETIRIRMVSRGTMPKVAMAHNVVVLKPGVNLDKFLAAGAPHRGTDFIAPELMSSVIARTPFAGPGETTEVVFTVPAKPGRYPYLCTFAGHFAAGMKGTLIVK